MLEPVTRSYVPTVVPIPRDPIGSRQLRETEVEGLDRPALREEQVGRLMSRCTIPAAGPSPVPARPAWRCRWRHPAPTALFPHTALAKLADDHVRTELGA